MVLCGCPVAIQQETPSSVRVQQDPAAEVKVRLGVIEGGGFGVDTFLEFVLPSVCADLACEVAERAYEICPCSTPPEQRQDRHSRVRRLALQPSRYERTN